MRLAVLALAMTAPLMAQTSHGYVYFAPGGATSSGYTAMTVNLGFGGEARIVSHLGAGAEAGVLAFRQDFAGSVMGTVSPTGYVHLVGSKEAKIDPFIGGGYSLFFRNYHENLVHFGGGVNFWPKRHLGVKIEVRDHVNTRYNAIHFWGFRFGLAFR